MQLAEAPFGTRAQKKHKTWDVRISERPSFFSGDHSRHLVNASANGKK